MYLSDILIAIIVIKALTCVVVAGCLYLATRFTWTRDGKKDTRRTWAYIVAAAGTVIDQILVLVTIFVATPYSFILAIFADLFNRVSQLLVLAIVAWTILQSLYIANQSTWQPLRVLRGGVAVLVFSIAGISLLVFGLDCALYVYSSSYEYPSEAFFLTTFIFRVMVHGLYLIPCVILAICATYFVVRERSKATWLLLSVVVFLTLYHIIEVVVHFIYYRPYYYFVMDPTTMAIYLLIAAIAMTQPYQMLVEEESTG